MDDRTISYSTRMKYPELNDEEFLLQVGSGRIEHFGHREHLRLAFLAARSSETLADVIARCRAGIRSVATARGAPDRYDEAVTAAWAQRMLEIVTAMPGASFDEVLSAHPELEDRQAALRSPSARRATSHARSSAGGSGRLSQ
jgi:hypothetical protein